MDNVQIRRMIFRRKTVQVRAPAEYVDIKNVFYAGCNYAHPLKWKIKRRRRKIKYVYTRMPVLFENIIPYIQREMECCENDPDTFDCRASAFHLWINDWFLSYTGFSIQPEMGVRYTGKEYSPYMSLDFCLENELTRTSLNIGTDNKLQFNLTADFDYNFLSFPLDAINPYRNWIIPNGYMHNSVFSNTYYVNVYGGSEYNLFSGEEEGTHQFNIHAGLGIQHAGTSYYRIFLQSGPAITFTNPVFSAGWLTKLGLNFIIYHR
jgi:hypothetical protein